MAVLWEIKNLDTEEIYLTFNLAGACRYLGIRILTKYPEIKVKCGHWLITRRLDELDDDVEDAFKLLKKFGVWFINVQDLKMSSLKAKTTCKKSRKNSILDNKLFEI